MDYRDLVQSLIDRYQSEIPLVERPYLLMAEELAVSEDEVMKTLSQMKSDNILSRVGAIYKTHGVGYSLLAACSVCSAQMEEASLFINQFIEVNHNYERENEINLWFVVTAATKERVLEVCSQIEEKCKVKVLQFPMVKPYKIDLSLNEKINWDYL